MSSIDCHVVFTGVPVLVVFSITSCKSFTSAPKLSSSLAKALPEKHRVLGLFVVVVVVVVRWWLVVVVVVVVVIVVIVCILLIVISVVYSCLLLFLFVVVVVVVVVVASCSHQCNP